MFAFIKRLWCVFFPVKTVRGIRTCEHCFKRTHDDMCLAGKITFVLRYSPYSPIPTREPQVHTSCLEMIQGQCGADRKLFTLKSW
jgi:hypothetical protein